MMDTMKKFYDVQTLQKRIDKPLPISDLKLELVMKHFTRFRIPVVHFIIPPSETKQQEEEITEIRFEGTAYPRIVFAISF